MANRLIRVITFDLDDTLWETKLVLTHAEHQVFNWLKEYAPKVTEHFSIESLAQWRWKKYNNSPQLAHQISQLRIDTMQQVMALVGYDKPSSKRLAKECFGVFINARHQVTLFEDVIPILEQLRTHYTLGTLTNGNADISRLAIAHLFDFSFRAEQVNASKPAPELFIAAQRAGSCRANEMIHVGDNIEHDVIGANQAGCHSLWYNPQTQTPPKNARASMEVHSLAQIPKTINDFENSLKNRKPSTG